MIRVALANSTTQSLWYLLTKIQSSSKVGWLWPQVICGQRF